MEDQADGPAVVDLTVVTVVSEDDWTDEPAAVLGDLQDRLWALAARRNVSVLNGPATVHTRIHEGRVVVIARSGSRSPG